MVDGQKSRWTNGQMDVRKTNPGIGRWMDGITDYV